MNAVFLILIGLAFCVGALNGTLPDTPMLGPGGQPIVGPDGQILMNPGVFNAALDSAKTAVTLAFGLLGPMALFLGVVQVLRDAGAVRGIARFVAPVMKWLFPEIPDGHPAMGAMVMNMAANIMGLGNAATPFGLKAMQELQKLNRHPGVATNSMVLFLAINTSGVAVFPSGVIAMRASLDSADPGGIVLPTILSTMVSTIVGVCAALWLSNRKSFSVARVLAGQADAAERAPAGPAKESSTVLDEDALVGEDRGPAPRFGPWLLRGFGVFVLFALVHEYLLSVVGIDVCAGLLHQGRAPGSLGTGEFITRVVMSNWLIPLFLAFALVFGYSRGVRVYESAIKGAKEGFQIFVMIVPFLVLILVAIGMFRASGALDAFTVLVTPLTGLIGFPPEALPMALVRPLSGGGATGVMMATMSDAGPDSFVGYLVSVMAGSTETTFYVLAVYFGSIQVRAFRHAVLACLCADGAGMLAALCWTRLLLG